MVHFSRYNSAANDIAITPALDLKVVPLGLTGMVPATTSDERTDVVVPICQPTLDGGNDGLKWRDQMTFVKNGLLCA
jgi:hypothetical protein